ncbi:MAG: hypothetical protein KAV18_05400 [Candidatus Omnitrophica bacterium]|nr:hypothetical protein [Candidatus Omnitrophota bacterium]
MKKQNRCLIVFMAIFLTLCCIGCATTANKAFVTNESQVLLRNMQTRAFDTTNKKLMMQTVISTMQDLEFVISKADITLGTLTGSKFLKQGTVVTMSVTVRARGEKQLLVRANARCGIKSVEDAETYQDFFNVLGKSLFLAAHQVD